MSDGQQSIRRSVMIKDIVVNLGPGRAGPGRRLRHLDGRGLRRACARRRLFLRAGHPGLGHGRHSAEFIEVAAPRSRTQGAQARSPASSRRPSAPASRPRRASLDASVAGAADQFGQHRAALRPRVVGQADARARRAEEVVDEGVLFESGRPVIVRAVHPERRPEARPRHGVLGRQPRRHPRHRRRLPLLKKAKTVEIVIVAGKAGKGDEIAGADLGQHLARHGLRSRSSASPRRTSTSPPRSVLRGGFHRPT